MGRFNDFDLTRWRELGDILTTSLWLFDHREGSGAHAPWYWGNFVPQIPHQLLRRFSRAGEWVLDPFVGSGTTLIECRRLGRNGLGVELNPAVAAQAIAQVQDEPNPSDVCTEIIIGNSAVLDFAPVLEERGTATAQLAILHPPYADILHFGDDPQDLSAAPSVPAFLDRFGQVVQRVAAVLDADRHLAVVIGDKYTQGEWIPLGFFVLGEVLRRGPFTLKAVVVKNVTETRGKRGQRALWRYRALRHGLYEFGHEYILLFQKTPCSQKQWPSYLRSPSPNGSE